VSNHINTKRVGILSKHTIQTWILPHLSVGKRGFESKVPLDEVVEAILHRLKTGCQWRELPVRHFFSSRLLTWQGVFYYFNKWTKQGCWQRMWIELLKVNHRHLDLSCIQLDGSHTPAKNGGQAIGYQARKAANTTNSLFLSDNQGIMIAISTPQEGNHHDLFEIQTLFDELCQVLTAAGINLRGLFLNADPGFDRAGGPVT
jgi:transposase